MSNKNNSSGSGIAIGFITFFLIGLLQSCNEAHVNREKDAFEMFNSNLPNIKIVEFLKPTKEVNAPIEEVIYSKNR